MRRSVVAWGLFASGALACRSAQETPTQPVIPPPVTVSISPRNVVISANATYAFTVAISPSSYAGDLVCSVEPSGVGAASVNPGGGCRLVTGASVMGGRLVASVRAKSDTASLIVFASGLLR